MRVSYRVKRLVFLLLVVPVGADEIRLKSGGKIEGKVLEDNGVDVWIETGSGQVKIPAAEVASIDTAHQAPIEEFYERLAKTKEAEDYCRLANWCAEQKMSRFVEFLRKRCLALDPQHPHFEVRETRLQEQADKPGAKTRVIPAPKRKPTRPENVVCGPRLVPPGAAVSEDGTIVYPIHSLPGPTYLGPDGMSVPYWGIPPPNVENEFGFDYASIRAEFNNGKFLEALKTWKVVERENDVLLLPPDISDQRHWRLIWSLAPRATALRGIEGVRSGRLVPKKEGATPR